ncbi:MAG: hypothetical protein V1735_04420 [Nanoarchaeota archaeon]
MEHSVKVGFSFGVASGIITTLGLMVGLEATASKAVVLGGIITIAIADAFSDALGIHMSEESEGKHSAKEVWTATVATWLTKFIVACTFIIPVLLLPLHTAVIVSVIWGLSVLSVRSYFLAKAEKTKAWHVIGEHLLIAVVVIIVTHIVGDFVASRFA